MSPTPGGFWDSEDEWHEAGWHARHVRPPPSARGYTERQTRQERERETRRVDYLVPETNFQSGSLHRSRSHGHAPAPNIRTDGPNIRIHLTQESRQDAKNETPAPPPAAPELPERRRSPSRGRHRSHRYIDEDVLDDEIEAEVRRQMRAEFRSRSRGRSDAGHWREPEQQHPSYSEFQLQLARDRLKEADAKLQWEKEEELIKKRMELKYMAQKAEREEEEAKFKAEEERIKKKYELKAAQEAARKRDEEEEMEQMRRRILLENQAKVAKAEAEAKEAKQRAVDEYERRKAKEAQEAKEARERVIAEYERKKERDEREEREAQEELLRKIKRQEAEKKEKEEAAYKEFLRKAKEKEEEEKAKKKKQEEELEQEMRKRLAQFGFQENQIQAVLDPEEAKKLRQGQSPANALPWQPQQPTYVKVHKDHLSVDTLAYYDIPWEYDRTNRDYIIILREMDNRETDILFEHTRRLRTRGTTRLLIQEKENKKPDYAWVRKRASPSPVRRTRRKSSPKRVGLGALLL
ncbi:hypothetical protein M501DRAFT_1013790 [Patellaria atrata CBS 101060]|uniref:Uncharacterized protein n=1 Tax=Patellaria atrata CBS 101060 TaxID=1346257 RepID=A0A9P4SH74_9PEZI|nr:hypothetical protein M501DRAFT_1013790 [Patellaria atrata CBS 101060]